MSETVSANVIGQLREALVGLKKSKYYKEIAEPQDKVLARFQPSFSPEGAGQITAEEFRSFLLFENNCHWTGLHRQGPRMCADMDKLRAAMGMLADESKPVAERLDASTEMVSGMGKNVASGILLIMHPDRYGVWNNRSEATMKELGIWPAFDRGESFGSRYVKVNNVLLQLRDALQTDLWTLDAVWWYWEQNEIPPGVPPPVVEAEQRFGLERHLHDFLRDNWNKIELGREWALYQEPGDDEAGYEYPTKVGRIDLLAKHRKEPRWLVVELKRRETSDQAVGQLLRYMGWVKSHVAEKGDKVQGMIICHESDAALHYALSAVPDVELSLYRVEFHLAKPDEPHAADNP